MPTMTPEDLIRLEQMRKLGMAVPQQPDVTAPATNATDYPQIHAQQLEQQAAPQQIQPQGIKQNIIAGIEGAFQPGGYTGMQFRNQQVERQRQQDLLTRAKELRGEGFQQQQLYNQEQDRQLTREMQQQNFNSEDALRMAQVKKLQQPDEYTLNPGDVRFKGQEPIATGLPKEPTAKNPGTRDRFDAKSGHVFRDYFNQSNPTAVTSSADLGPPQSSVNERQDQVVQYQDPDSGRWTIGTINKGNGEIKPANVQGQAVSGTAGKLTGTQANRSTASASIQEMIPELIQKIQAHRNEFGAVVGRGENFVLKAGIKNPEMRDIQSGLMSLTPLLLTLHTGNPRSKQMMDEFGAAIGRIGEDPDNAIAALSRQLDTAQTIKAAQEDVMGTRLAGHADTGKPIVQRNKKTGATRFSTDGGKTWQSGSPK